MQTGTLWFRGLTASQGIHLVSSTGSHNEGQVPTLGQSNQCGSGANKSQKQQFAYCTATGEVPGPPSTRGDFCSWANPTICICHWASIGQCLIYPLVEISCQWPVGPFFFPFRNLCLFVRPENVAPSIDTVQHSAVSFTSSSPEKKNSFDFQSHFLACWMVSGWMSVANCWAWDIVMRCSFIGDRFLPTPHVSIFSKNIQIFWFDLNISSTTQLNVLPMNNLKFKHLLN